MDPLIPLACTPGALGRCGRLFLGFWSCRPAVVPRRAGFDVAA